MTAWPIDPFGMSATEWTDAMAINFEEFGNLPRLENTDAWQAWAEQVLNLPGLSGSIVPDPYAFARWEDWAAQLNAVM